MDWPITEAPTWIERQDYGPRLTHGQAAEIIYEQSKEPLAWRHIHLLATMMNENQLYAWARPIVWKPGDVAHLSVDRGVCALNSHWWAWVPDTIAYDPPEAFRTVIEWLETKAADGIKGAKPWDWGPLLGWQWHGYQPGTDHYNDALAAARIAINAVRADHNVTGL